MAQPLKRFALGVQDFAIFKEDGKYYVDKTDLLHKMVKGDRYNFLSRPRRFGKSLLVSTLKYYFEGRKDLFEGLAISKLETEWKSYPVISLSFAGSYDSAERLGDRINDELSQHETKFGIPQTDSRSWGVRLSRIIRTAVQKTGAQAVILIDEYDAPLMNALHDPKLLKSLRTELNNLFNPLKDLGSHLRFLFITGISRFSQLSIFSAINNLKIISMNDAYAGICGITKEELLTQFKPEIQALADVNSISFDEACTALARKYDGYHFSKNSPDVYNPFSLINALSDGELGNYWFTSGTPTALTRRIAEYNIDPLTFESGLSSTSERFDAPIETTSDPIPLLYQTGYLTIKNHDDGIFSLGFPNDEVAIGFLKCLLPFYTTDNGDDDVLVAEFAKNLRTLNLDAALEQMRAFFSSIPYDAERQDENHYKTVFYIIFRLLTKFRIETEMRSAAGRADVVVETKDAVCVFEFKLKPRGSAKAALKQIDDKGYLIPYSAVPGKKLFKIGVVFDPVRRTLGKWLIKEAT